MIGNNPKCASVRNWINKWVCSHKGKLLIYKQELGCSADTDMEKSPRIYEVKERRWQNSASFVKEVRLNIF